MAAMHTNGHPSSREVQHEINRIRHEMDHTLDEIGDYLHPKHLLDYFIDSVRSGSSGASKERARAMARQGADAVKAHPGPAMLMAGAALWYLMDRGRDQERPIHRGGEGPDIHGRRRTATYGAWEAGYDWTSAKEDESTWSEKARDALDKVRSVVSDQSLAAKDKIKAVANHMMSASGKSRDELHAQWANLREHAGSFVDARTGEPYADEYGDGTLSEAVACAYLCDEKRDESSWSSQAQDAVNAMSQSLKNTGASVKEQFRALGSQLSSLASSSRSALGGAAHRARGGMSRGYESASGSMHSMAGAARHEADRLGGALQDGIHRSRESFSQTLREQPFAVGAAFLGLGLLAGLAAPRTHAEDELMGESADRLKDRARDAGEDALERGKEAASAVANTAAEEALKHGEEAVSAVADATAKEAERQGVTPQKAADKAKQAVGK